MFNSRKYTSRYYPTRYARKITPPKREYYFEAILAGLIIGGIPLVAYLIKFIW